MRKRVVYIVLIVIFVVIHLITALYVNGRVTPEATGLYFLKNVIQLSSLILIGVFSTLLYKLMKSDK